MSTILNTVASYLDSLTATHQICVALGTTLSFGTNLFIYYEPDKSVSTVTILPAPMGMTPDKDNEKYEAYFQVRLKTNTNNRAIETQQKIINTLHMKEVGSRGKVRALQSMPSDIEQVEAGEWKACTTSYNIKYIKV